MVIRDQDCPLVLRQKPHSLADTSGFIDVAFTAAFTIRVSACIDRVAQDGVDGNIGGLDPKDLSILTLMRKGQSFGLKPNPHLTSRAQLRKLLEDGADCTGDGLIGMKDHLPFAFTPDESYGQAATEFSSVGFIANGAVEAHAQDVQLGFGHSAFESEQKAVIEQAWMIETVQVTDQRVGDATQFQQPIPLGVVARNARSFQT